MNKIHIGVDPGKNGAIVINYHGNISSLKFPLIGDEYDIRSLYEVFKSWQSYNVHMVIEDVHALQKPFDSGNWSLSAGKHILMTLAIVCEIPHTLVQPKVWQKKMWQGVKEQRKPDVKVKTKSGKEIVKQGSILTKEMSLIAAKRLFPDVDLRDPDRKTERAQKEHDGVVDALLMCEYSRRKFD